MHWLLLALSIAAVAFTVHAFRPLRLNRKVMWPAFFAAWLTVELALHHVAWQAAVIALMTYASDTSHWASWTAVGLMGVNWIGLVAHHIASRRADLIVGRSLQAAELHPHPGRARYPRSHLLWPPLAWHRRDVVITRGIEFARVGDEALHLDMFTSRGGGTRRPALVQIHGGAWMVGHKEYQGIPLLGHLAANGWVCFNIDYRLSPQATFPDHLVDVKRAIAWIRNHAADFGIDPDFIAVTGGSAGGHLAALAALTSDEPEYQPGFESADTSVQAAAIFYGVYDFTNRHRQRPAGYVDFLERVVMKRSFVTDREAFVRASPLFRVHAGAPPFFVIHGSRDTISPVIDARVFAEELREVSRSTVVYAEIHGAQHAFDVFPSVRTLPVLEAVERFLHAAWSAHVQGRGGDAIAEASQRALTTAEATL